MSARSTSRSLLFNYLPLLLVAVASLWLGLQPNLHIGRIGHVEDIGAGYAYARLEAPFREPVSLILSNELREAQGVLEGHWALVHGADARVEDRPIFKVDQTLVAPFATPDPAGLSPFVGLLMVDKTELILIAIATLALGLRTIRLTVQIALAAAVADFAYVATTTAAANGLIVEPSGLGFMLIAFGCAAAMILGTGVLAERDGLIFRSVASVAIWSFLPPVAEALNLSPIAALALASLAFPLPILVPIAISATLMIQALEPHDLATRAAIVAACAVFALIAHLSLARRSQVYQNARARRIVEILPPAPRSAA